MSDVIVYGKPGCRACVSTKRELDKRGIEYKYVDFTQDSEAQEFVLGGNFKAAPVVVSPVGTWTGLDEDKIAELDAHQ